MEDEGADFQLISNKIDTKSIITIQAIIRGALVRKWMREIRQSFTDVVNHLERNPLIGVEWNRVSPCLPKVSRKRQSKPTTVNPAEERPKESSMNNGFNKLKQFPPHATITVNEDDENYDVERPIDHHLNSVETQTSFIEIGNTNTHYQKDRENSTGHFVIQPCTDQSDIHVSTDRETYSKDERKSQRETCLDLHHSMEDEPRSEHTGSEQSQSRHSEIESLSECRLSLTEVTKLNLVDMSDDEDMLEEAKKKSGRRSSRSAGSNKDKTAKAFNPGMKKETEELIEVENNSGSGRSSQRSSCSNKHIEDMTQVEQFSDNTGHSARSERSNRSGSSKKTAQKTNRDSDISDRLDYDTDILHKAHSPLLDKDPWSDQSIKSQGSGKNSAGAAADRTVYTQHSRDKDDCGRSQCSQRSSRDRASHRSVEGKNEVSEMRRDHSPVSDRSEVSLRSQRSDRSEKSTQSVKTDRSRRSDTSQRSKASQRSEVSQRSEGSHKSEGSQRSKDSQRSHRSKTAHSPQSHIDHGLTSPRPFSESPVPVSRREESQRQPQPFQRSSNQDSTTLTNVTSIWDSFNSCRVSESQDFEIPVAMPEDANSLRDLRKNISMELLWVQQAIDSRKNYLKLKNKM